MEVFLGFKVTFLYQIGNGKMIFGKSRLPAKEEPSLRKFRKASFLLALAFIFFSAQSYADTGILDNIATSYKNASTGWATTLLGYANRLFMLLATIELAWSFGVWAMDKSELQGFTSAIVKKIMWIGLFYALLLNGSTWIPLIVDSFTQAGSAAGGAGAGLSPSEIFTTGLDNAATMLQGIKDMSLWDDFATIVIAGLAAIAIVLAFAVIAGQLLIALIESYIAISAGLLFLGFGGSRWTTDFVQKFIGYAVATGVKLFMLFLIVGIGNTQALQWKSMLQTIGQPGAPVFNLILTVFGGSIILAVIAVQIPAMAASMLSGSPTMTAGAAAGTAAMGAAGVVGAGAMGAASTISAAKSVGGAASATSAAFGEAGAQGKSGLGRAVGTLGNLGTAAARDTSNRMGEAISQTKGGRMADISQARGAEMSAGGGGVSPPSSAAGGAAASAQAPGASAGGGGGGSGTPAAPGGGSGTPAAPAKASSNWSDTGAVSTPAVGTANNWSDSGAVAAADTSNSSAASSNNWSDSGAVAAPSNSSSDGASSTASASSDASSSTASASSDAASSTAPPSSDASSSTASASSDAASSTAPPSSDASSSTASASSDAASSTAPPSSDASSSTASPSSDAASSTAPPSSDAASSTASASSDAASSTAPPSSDAASSTAPAPSGVSEKEKDKPSAPGFEDRFRQLSQVRPPQLPHDGAPAATVHIRFDSPQD
ncbi:P-type conjugative transfer protein TrbL [Comamonas thiooxydans]|uniref:P-type conjugative transfer protein TrbL n=1 Tax=Comamonas thiooxydans TaxID=363952 RepID=UPI0009B7F7F7|nr:P-type conjugative transfer protein TrbL [Comamonas thiooxydans]